MVISCTPFRVSFFGGGTDYPAWYREHGGGAVLATTIDKYCYIRVRELPRFFDHRFRIVYSRIELAKEIDDIQHPAVRAVLSRLGVTKGLEIHHDGDLPARSGLGSSSAFTVGLISAIHTLDGRHRSKEALANEAIYVEQCLLREPVGVQDQISTAFGGFNHITFSAQGSYQVNPVIVPRARLAVLEQHLMLVFTGLSRFAATVAQAQIDNVKSCLVELRTMRQMVDEAVAIVTSPTRGLEEFGQLLHEAWKIKRTLSPRISSPAIDDLYNAALRAGARGGKLLGAGGGGFLLLFVRPEDRVRVAAALGGRTTVPVRFETSGSRIVLYEPDGVSTGDG